MECKNLSGISDIKFLNETMRQRAEALLESKMQELYAANESLREKPDLQSEIQLSIRDCNRALHELDQLVHYNLLTKLFENPANFEHLEEFIHDNRVSSVR